MLQRTEHQEGGSLLTKEGLEESADQLKLLVKEGATS